MAGPWRQVFPGTWSTVEAAFSSALPGKLVAEAMLGAAPAGGSLACPAPSALVLTGQAPTLAVSVSLQVPPNQTMNLLSYTRGLDVTGWSTYAVGTASPATVTRNYAAAPDGSQTAHRIQLNKGAGNTGSDDTALTQSVTVTPGTTRPWRQAVWMRSTDGVSSYNVSLDNSGAYVAVTVTGTWQRFEHVWNFDGTGGSVNINTPTLRGGRGNSTTCDVLIWHPQLEVSTYLHDYQENVGAGTGEVWTDAPHARFSSAAPTLQVTAGANLVCPSPTGLSLLGMAAALLVSIAAPSPSALALTSPGPALAASLGAPAPAALALTGKVPALAVGLAAPTPAGLALTAQAPAISAALASPVPSALTLTGQAPTLSAAGSTSLPCPAPVALSLTGTAPSLSASLAAQPGALALTGRVPALALALPASAASLTLGGLAPTLNVTGPVFLVCPAPAGMSLAGIAPALQVTGLITPIPTLTWAVSGEVRAITVPAEARALAVAAEVRTITVRSESRTFTVPYEWRAA